MGNEWECLYICTVVSPAGVQEILDYGVYGYAHVTVFSGLWVGLKTMKSTVEATAVGRMAGH